MQNASQRGIAVITAAASFISCSEESWTASHWVHTAHAGFMHLNFWPAVFKKLCPECQGYELRGGGLEQFTCVVACYQPVCGGVPWQLTVCAS